MFDYTMDDIGEARCAPKKVIRECDRKVWNDERVELLKKLWAEGLSCSHIAARLGGVSRNGVIGKIHRLGLSGRKTVYRIKSKPRARRAAPQRKPKYFQPQPVKAPTLREKLLNLQSEPLPPEPARPANLVTLAKLTDSQCRFPFGDPKTSDFGFCGCEKAPGSNYCAGHHVMCTQAPEPRRRIKNMDGPRTQTYLQFVDHTLEAVR